MLKTSLHISASLIALALAGGALSRAASASSAAAAKPILSLAAGIYAGTQSVTLTDATAGFVIHYTINGTIPTAASTVYKGPIAVTSTRTIKAIAVAAGYANSAVASATYTIAATGIVATPASLTFPITKIGSKAVTKVVTLKNTGTTPIASLSINLAGAAASAYSKSQTCGSTLAAGASCTISVAFDPKTSGDLAAVLRVGGSGARGAAIFIDGLCADSTAPAPDANLYNFSTTQGDIYVALRPDVAPKNVANFLYYVNNGTYTKTIFHRVVAGFINQGGGFKVNSNGQPVQSTTAAPVVNEFKLSNIRGTVAMAKLASNPNSATDQFFFNTANNSSLDTQDGGFTVIGQIVGLQGAAAASQSAGLAVMDAINADTVYNFGSPFDSIPLLNYAGTGYVQPSNFVYINAITPVRLKTGAPATPVFSLKSGTYQGAQSVTLKDSTPGATIYYYSFQSAVPEVVKYTGPFTISKSQNVLAYAAAPGYPNASYLSYESYGITE